MLFSFVYYFTRWISFLMVQGTFPLVSKTSKKQKDLNIFVDKKSLYILNKSLL